MLTLWESTRGHFRWQLLTSLLWFHCETYSPYCEVNDCSTWHQSRQVPDSHVAPMSRSPFQSHWWLLCRFQKTGSVTFRCCCMWLWMLPWEFSACSSVTPRWRRTGGWLLWTSAGKPTITDFRKDSVDFCCHRVGILTSLLLLGRRVMKIVESHGIPDWQNAGLESHGKWEQFVRNHGKVGCVQGFRNLFR